MAYMCSLKKDIVGIDKTLADIEHKLKDSRRGRRGCMKNVAGVRTTHMNKQVPIRQHRALQSMSCNNVLWRTGVAHIYMLTRTHV